MAMIRLDIPGLILYGGSIDAGHYHGRDVTIQDVNEAIGAWSSEFFCSSTSPVASSTTMTRAEFNGTSAQAAWALSKARPARRACNRRRGDDRAEVFTRGVSTGLAVAERVLRPARCRGHRIQGVPRESVHGPVAATESGAR